jgi:hypothetical protein
MAMREVFEVVATIGEYQNRQGETKREYLKVGSLMQGDDGRQALVLKRHINLAGLPEKNGRVWLNLYEPKPREGQQPAQRQAAQTAEPEFDNDIPF